MSNQLTTKQPLDLGPQTFEQALIFSKHLADSDLVPKDFKGKPGNCLIAIQWGAELGLKPLQAIQNIAIINGRPALWGDAVIALVRSSPLCEYVVEIDDGNTATCKVKRKGEQEQTRTFSMEDARAAGLAGKQGTWSQYPKRMRQMRARAFALRDVFPDVLRGLPVAEEIMDISTDKHMITAEIIDNSTGEIISKPEVTRELPLYTDAQLEKNLPAWQKAIDAGKTNAEGIITKITSGYNLTPEQEERIRALKKWQPTEEELAEIQAREMEESRQGDQQ